MKVHFKNMWFGPDQRRYRKCESRHETRDVPDEYLKLLPSTATVVVGPEVIETIVEPKMGTGIGIREAENDTLKSAWDDAEKVVQAAEARHDEALDKDEAKRQAARDRMAHARAVKAQNQAQKGQAA